MNGKKCDPIVNVQLPASKPPSVNMLLIDGVWQDIFFGLKVNFLISIRVW